MKIQQVTREEFFSIVKSIKYREQDEKEAKEFGEQTVYNTYRHAIHTFARYYVILDTDDTPIVTVMLQRNGRIAFFISETVSSPIRLVKVLKKFADDTVKCTGPIVTKTAYWYEEAQRLNKLIGFKQLELYNMFGLYYYGEA